MNRPFHEHHSRNLCRARDALTEAIISLQSALGRMTGDDWIDANEVLRQLTGDIGPRLAALRTASVDRFNDHTRLPDFEEMRTGKRLYPDERAAAPEPPVLRAVEPDPTSFPEPLGFPNAQIGAELVAKHGSVDKAMMAYQPDSAEFDHIQAYRYVSTGKRPKGWIPPIVRRVGDDELEDDAA